MGFAEAQAKFEQNSLFSFRPRRGRVSPAGERLANDAGNNNTPRRGANVAACWAKANGRRFSFRRLRVRLVRAIQQAARRSGEAFQRGPIRYAYRRRGPVGLQSFVERLR